MRCENASAAGERTETGLRDLGGGPNAHEYRPGILTVDARIDRVEVDFTGGYPEMVIKAKAGPWSIDIVEPVPEALQEAIEKALRRHTFR